MVDTATFPDLVAAAGNRAGAIALVAALGFDPVAEEVPPPAWPAYGLAGATGLAEVVVAGRAGSVDALLLVLDAPVSVERATALAAAVRARNPVRSHLFAILSPSRLILGLHGPDGDFRHLLLEPDRIRASDVDALEEMAARDGETGLALALRQARALHRGRVTRLFFRDFRAHRTAIANAFTGLPLDARAERARLAILLLCRLTFLYFLQRRGTLCGDDRFLPRLLGEWKGGQAVSFYRGRLVPLFFGALNRPPEERTPAARALGPLPYLNGGLFEPHALERRFPALDVPDPVVRASIEGLLERYRFTAREAGAGAGYGIDPEVLGRVFEGLMAPRERGDTGTFYTPAPVVNRVVREAVGEYLAGACPGMDPTRILDDGEDAGSPGSQPRVRRALERVRVLDPACGSGAFLLGALHYLARALGAVTEQPDSAVRREIVARSLHGVDLLDDAALLCALRLWLALSEGEDEVRPLPNLDRRIRQGDALVDPLDLPAAAGAGPGAPAAHPLAEPELRQAYQAVGPAARRYLDSSPADRDAARAELARAELALASRWIRRVRHVEHQRLRRLRAAAQDRDLFGEPSEHARQAQRELPRIDDRVREIDEIDRHLQEKGALPFFSFGVHFADAAQGFDLVVSNPPWVRAHRWPERVRRIAARTYEVCRTAGWPAAADLLGNRTGAGAQVDLSLLFLERACRLLAPGGILAMLIPAKAMRALYGGGARRMLLRDLEFALIEDHALDQRSIFRADAFAAVLIARRPPTVGQPAGSVAGTCDAAGRGVRVRMVRRGVQPLEFRTTAASLPLFPSDPASPWLVAPPDVVAVLRTMQAAGGPVGRHDGLRVRRGIMTGANDVLVMRSVVPKLGGLARVEAAGYAAARRQGASTRAAGRYRAWVETAALRPLVRGADIDAFRADPGAHVVWCHGPGGEPRPTPPRLARYLERHRPALERRPGWRGGLPLGCVFRLSAETLRPKVAWHDLSDTLRAVALPARVSFDGAERELLPLNTVYFIPVEREREAMLLAGLFNSLPVRTFARVVAERAKDARFRFLAWTVACLPLPANWRTAPAAREVLDLSLAAHQAGGMGAADADRLDHAAARLFGLQPRDLEVLARFDRWLRGKP
jgi:hypothetical protein